MTRQRDPKLTGGAARHSQHKTKHKQARDWVKSSPTSDDSVKIRHARRQQLRAAGERAALGSRALLEDLLHLSTLQQLLAQVQVPHGHARGQERRHERERFVDIRALDAGHGDRNE